MALYSSPSLPTLICTPCLFVRIGDQEESHSRHQSASLGGNRHLSGCGSGKEAVHDYLSPAGDCPTLLTVNSVAIEDTFAEAFPMTAARVVVTAETLGWARTAG